ncbi:hypothetical protein BJ878DRAFT_497689 [Calycina marina]|uniref:Uncharacterized protein n=1 Tax=Calycina marina TaxID=1763456 RepID=A0A9P8CGW8_9HELO|nr:hypothetical protein BJ878DRAFT_497689 [Calycina marina]
MCITNWIKLRWFDSCVLRPLAMVQVGDPLPRYICIQRSTDQRSLILFLPLLPFWPISHLFLISLLHKTFAVCCIFYFPFTFSFLRC